MDKDLLWNALQVSVHQDLCVSDMCKLNPVKSILVKIHLILTSFACCLVKKSNLTVMYYRQTADISSWFSYIINK